MGLVTRAGNASDDTERLKLLNELKARGDISPELRAETEKILTVVQGWVDSDGKKQKLGACIDRFKEKYWAANSIPKNSPLYPIEVAYRARLSVGSLLQSPPANPAAAKRAFEKQKARLVAASQAFPNNALLKMYAGTPTPWVRTYPDDAHAPEWANLQRRSLEGFTDIIHWWIDNRQQTSGEFGGGIGDDVEMWRWWVPVLIGFSDPKIEAAQEKLSRRALARLDAHGGYVTMSDAEHSTEDFSDSVTPMLHLQPDNREWFDRALTVEKFMREKWLGQNQRGFWQFKNVMFGSQGIGTNASNAFETPYHARATQPLMVAWLRTDDERIGLLAKDWLAGWIDATAREELGKPAGIIPAAVHWPSGAPRSEAEDQWWHPYKRTLYDFPNAMALLTDSLLAAWQQTGDEKYLQPIRSMARICLENRNASAGAAPGSAAWCAYKLLTHTRQGPFLLTVAKYTLLTGDRTYESLINDAYVSFRLSGNRQPMVDALRKSADALSRNFECYTTEVRWTDRVVDFPRRYYASAVPELAALPDYTLIFNTATGNAGMAMNYANNAVRWLTSPRNIAALVTDTGKKKFAAELYHFGDKPREMEAELLLLERGQYEAVLRMTDGAKKELSRQSFAVKGARARVKITLPSRELCFLEISAR